MATVMLMHWPEVTRELYEQARKEINWEGDVPPGAKLHVSWFDQNGFHVFDLWDSQEDFERFGRERLMPGLQQIGFRGQPKVEMASAYLVFAPNI